MAVSRTDRPGCKSGFEFSCVKMSGEALTSAQELPPATAMEDWVRARARIVPSRSPEQLGQLQFHWGKPPPAADPRTRIFTQLQVLPVGTARGSGRAPSLFSDWTHTS